MYGKCVSLMLSQQKYGSNVCTVSTNISLTTKNNQLWSTLIWLSLLFTDLSPFRLIWHASIQVTSIL